MKTYKHMPKSVTVSSPLNYKGRYTYDLTYDQRDGHDPWNWFAEGEKRDIYPHFTFYSTNFDQAGFLTRFHMSMKHGGRDGLHIYFNVNQAGIVKFTNADGARLAGGQQDAEAWAKTNKTNLEQLAQDFVTGALGD